MPGTIYFFLTTKMVGNSSCFSEKKLFLWRVLLAGMNVLSDVQKCVGEELLFLQLRVATFTSSCWYYIKLMISRTITSGNFWEQLKCFPAVAALFCRMGGGFFSKKCSSAFIGWTCYKSEKCIFSGLSFPRNYFLVSFVALNKISWEHRWVLVSLELKYLLEKIISKKNQGSLAP